VANQRLGIGGGGLILALSLGVRHGFGLFLAPMSADFGWGREVFAFAIALQNLIWGLAQPFAGALADRLGAAKVVIIGGILYATGLVLMGMADSAWSLSLSAGLLIGIGLSGTSFSVILGVVGRAVPPENAAWPWASPAPPVRLASSPCCPAPSA
jgi:MFS family permease